MLENGAQAHLNTVGAAINHEDVHDISNISFGRSEDFSANEATTAANRVMDQPNIGVDKGVLVTNYQLGCGGEIPGFDKSVLLDCRTQSHRKAAAIIH